MNKPAVSFIPAEHAGSGTFQLESFLPYQLACCAHRVSTALSKLYADKYEIGIPEWRVIVILGEFGSATAKAIGQRSQMHKTKVSRAIALLEKRKFITRRANTADLREAFVSLTPEGHAIYDEITPAALSFADRLIEAVDPCDREAFKRALARLSEQSAAIGDMTTASVPG